MAQSSDSNLRGIAAFGTNHTVEPPTHWSNWMDQFHVEKIAKDNIDIDNLKNPLESDTDISFFEGAQCS